MRALLGMVLFSMVGCDQLWGSYVGQADLSTDGGTVCAAPGGCDLASGELPDGALPDGSVPPPDLQPPVCSDDTACTAAPNLFCDLNTSSCVATKPPTTAFLEGQAGETFTLLNQYMLMATGDYNGDGFGDVAVSGVFPSATGGSINATTAAAVPVEIYLGNGMGGLTKDANCPIPATEKPVYLLTIPGAKKELMVATFDGAVYRCSRATGAWVQTPVPVGGTLNSGFKQMAQISNPGPSADLAVRIGKSPFPDSNSGILEIHRGNATNSYNGLKIVITTTNATWVMPFRFANATTDTIATTWDAISGHPGIEFHTIDAVSNMESSLGSGSTGAANVTGGKFLELNMAPYAMLNLFHIAGQPAAILYSYSQLPNSLNVFAGGSVGALAQVGQKNLGVTGPLGLMQAYAGDANSDTQDEIGFYTMSTNNVQITRHLQLLMYKNSAIGNAIYDTTLNGENFRGMALETLHGSKDPNRKDLIALIEDPVNKGSRLLVRRANLNYVNNTTNF